MLGNHPERNPGAFVIDKEGFKTYLMHNLGWDIKIIDAEFKAANIH